MTQQTLHPTNAIAPASAAPASDVPAPAPRDRAALRRHFDIERELANRLRSAPAERRRTLYGEVYNELFARVPDHPQNAWRADPHTQQARATSQWRLLKHFCHRDSVYLEIGAGDGYLAMQVAAEVRHAYAVDVSNVIADSANRPANFTPLISDGIHTGIPPGAATIAYSNQLMEHLHPDDAAAQLAEIAKSLAPGGKYLCVTPHRYSGPWDVSQFFCDEAEGFHLKEYTYGELRQLFRRAGFASTEIWAGLKGRFLRVPEWCVLAIEKTLGVLPRRLQKPLARFALRPVFVNVTLVGIVR
jgi:SAM-dependent methyltransferase